MINPFSIILLMLIGFGFFKYRQSLKKLFFYIILLTVSIEVFVEVGFFLKINALEISYRRFSELALLVVSLGVIIAKPFIGTRILKYSTALIGVLLISIVSLLIFPSNVSVANISSSWDEILMQNKEIVHPEISSFVFQQNFQLVIYIIALLAIYTSFKRENYYGLLLSFTKVIKFFLAFGLFEFLLKYILRFEGYGDVIKFIFGYSDSTIYEARSRGFGLELTGITREASHYSFVLFVCTTILFAAYIFTGNKHFKKWIFLCMFLFLFCMSFSSLLFMTCLLFIYILYRLKLKNNPKYNLAFNLFSLFGVLFIILFLFSSSHINISSSDGDFFLRRLASLREEMSVIFDNSWQVEKTALEWSNRVRLLSIFMTLKAFAARPLFGYGFGTVTCHGATAMMLAGTGIVGLFFWTKLNFYVNRILTPDDYRNKFFTYSILIYLFLNLFNSFALRPFHELYSFLIAISLSLIFESKKTYEHNVDYTLL